MLERLSRFFLLNPKIAVVLMATVTLFGIGAYMLLPKQYNPSIVAPAFAISVSVPGYSSSDAYRSVATTLENVLSELPGIDTLSSSSRDGGVSVMVSFEVGTDQEEAKTRLYDRLSARTDLRPFGVGDLHIQSIDPEDLPQVSFAIMSTATGLDAETAGLAARHAASMLRDAIKLVPGTSVVETLGGLRWDAYIVLDPERLDAAGLDLDAVVAVIRDRTVRSALGQRRWDDGTMTVVVESEGSALESLPNIPLAGAAGNRVLLRDVAEIRRSPDVPDSYRLYSDHLVRSSDAVFLAVAKTKGVNAVSMVDGVLAAAESVKARLPQDIRIVTVQNEWAAARAATNELLLHLFVSIAVVVGVLVAFLGWRNALNAAFCIPLVLAIVFIVALALGLDINRITLFALILSLGILVDDSIVMVENNARHLDDMTRTGRTKIEALLDSVREVGSSVLFSTVTRVMSFVAMFAVTGMMGDYMRPIPVFASIALVASFFVAFSINPYLAALFHRASPSGHHQEGRGKLLAAYARTIARFSGGDRAAKTRRRYLRIGFWSALVFILAVPVMLDVFRARMLPKADKDQVYLWVDMPAGTTLAQTRDAAMLATDALLDAPPDIAVVKDVSVGVGAKLPDDFANLFRGGSFRRGENQFSARIGLAGHEERDIRSEEFVIRMRPLLHEAVSSKYPDARIRLLEDPPGPPTMATFEARLKGGIDTTAPELIRFSEAVESMVRDRASAQSLEELTSSAESARMRTVVRLDPARLLDRGLDVARVANTLSLAYNPVVVAPLASDPWTREPRDIVIELPQRATAQESFLWNTALTNASGERVRLDEVADISAEPAEPRIDSHGRAPTVTLSAEMGDNSVIYPVIALYGALRSPEFEALGYRAVSATPYGIEFTGVADGKQYRLEWGGEWEITMDTFRDLGTAMILSLLAIYFLIVAQFGGFRTGGLVMTTFLLSFFGIMPGFSLLYLVSGEYFTATAMIGAIALGGIVVGNAILIIDAIDRSLESGLGVAEAVAEGAKKRVMPVMLTSLAAILGSFVITSDPVWSGLAWSIITGLSASALLTLFFIPVFYSDHIRKRTSS